jgi:hypothetical protein
MLVGERPTTHELRRVLAVTQCMSQRVGRHQGFRVFALPHKKPCGDDTPQSLIELES